MKALERLWWRRLIMSVAIAAAFLWAFRYGLDEKLDLGMHTILFFAAALSISNVISAAEDPPWSRR